MANNVRIVYISVEIAIKEDGKFLDISRVPDQLKLRSRLAAYLYRRNSYNEFIADILASLPRKRCKTIAILGTAGIGNSSLFLVLLQLLLEDPSQFGLKSRSFYYQTRPDVTWLYNHEFGSAFSVRFVPVGERLDASILLFTDIETTDGSPTEHGGVSIIFTPFRPSRFKELTKNGWRKVMPPWSANEQTAFFQSSHFEHEYGEGVAQRAYENMEFFGGSIRSNIQVALSEENPAQIVDYEVQTKGPLVCQRYYSTGFGGIEDFGTDVLVHRHPRKVDNMYNNMHNRHNMYNYNAEPCAYSFASPYVLRRFLKLRGSTLATEARAKYSNDTVLGREEGSDFELLCLHGFKISNVEFVAQPLTDDANAVTVRFPPKQVLVLSWREQKNYLQANVLYLPPYGSLECGSAFCLMKINDRRTLVVLLCTAAEAHPVSQKGLKTIHDCYTKNSALRVDDTVLMFMVPVNGKLKSKQPLVAQKEDGAQTDAELVAIEVTAQYKIVNALVTVDDGAKHMHW